MNRDKIQAVLDTLNQIEVRGKLNMDMLLGCIVTLEAELKREEEQPNVLDGN